MIRRAFAAASSALLVLPLAAAAQVVPYPTDFDVGPRLRVTPFIGYMTAVERMEDWTFQVNGDVVTLRSAVDLGGGTAAGVNAEAPLRGRFGVIAAAAFASRGNTVVEVSGTGRPELIDGSRVLLARLGAVYHMPEDASEFVLRRLGASAYAGGTVLHEMPRSSLGTGLDLRRGTHLGLNFGVAGELPFAQDRFAVQAAVEDHVMFWNRGALANLPYEYFERPGESQRQITVRTSLSHVWLFRAGVSYRFR